METRMQGWWRLSLTGWLVVIGMPGLHAFAHAPGAGKMPAASMSEVQGGDFTLTSHHGDDARVSLQDYRGKVVLLTFGYTHCPDVCPLLLTRLQQLMHTLGAQDQEVQTLFITFDPERDTPERLQTYLANFHPRFIGLTGSAADIRNVSRQYGVLHLKLQGEAAAEYFYAHTDDVFLIDRQGRLQARYPSETPLEHMASEIQRLIVSQP